MPDVHTVEFRRSAFSAPGRPQPDRATPGVRVALAVIRGYKLLISPYFRGSCRFLPSCADYAAAAVSQHGVVAGCWLALRRLARCHPLGRSGYDPVPRSLRANHDVQQGTRH